jgi:hypothetical protein
VSARSAGELAAADAVECQEFQPNNWRATRWQRETRQRNRRTPGDEIVTAVISFPTEERRNGLETGENVTTFVEACAKP